MNNIGVHDMQNCGEYKKKKISELPILYIYTYILNK